MSQLGVSWGLVDTLRHRLSFLRPMLSLLARSREACAASALLLSPSLCLCSRRMQPHAGLLEHLHANPQAGAVIVFKHASTFQGLTPAAQTAAEFPKLIQISSCPNEICCSWAPCARSCSDSALPAQTQGPSKSPDSPCSRRWPESGVLEAHPVLRETCGMHHLSR